MTGSISAELYLNPCTTASTPSTAPSSYCTTARDGSTTSGSRGQRQGTGRQHQEQGKAGEQTKGGNSLARHQAPSDRTLHCTAMPNGGGCRIQRRDIGPSPLDRDRPNRCRRSSALARKEFHSVAVQAAFPVPQHMTTPELMNQGSDEAVGTFLVCLTIAFDCHSSMEHPNAMGGSPLSAYESNLKSLCLSRMHPSLAEACRRSCITWKSCSLADILQHAENEDNIQKRQDTLKKKKKQEKMDEAQLTMYNAMTSGARRR
eukprot:superscaffoldBa00008308_g23243